VVPLQEAGTDNQVVVEMGFKGEKLAKFWYCQCEALAIPNFASKNYFTKYKIPIVPDRSGWKITLPAWVMRTSCGAARRMISLFKNSASSFEVVWVTKTRSRSKLVQMRRQIIQHHLKPLLACSTRFFFYAQPAILVYFDDWMDFKHTPDNCLNGGTAPTFIDIFHRIDHKGSVQF